jgi:hypothetical protein
LHRLLAYAAVFLLGTLGHAQEVILPPGAATSAPASTVTSSPFVFYSDLFTFPPRASHCQLIYPTSDVGQASALWRSLAVRRPADVATMNPAGVTQATVVISVAPLPYDAMTTTFAANHGPRPVTVLSGAVSLPARAQPGSWPAPWENVIPFTTPFPFSRTSGASLVVDILQTGNTAPSAWLVEATGPDPGDRTDNPTWPATCRFSNGEFNSFLSYQPPTLGAAWSLSYQPLPPNLVGAGVLGTEGVGGSWGGQRLPIDLTPLGAPGCTWNVSVDVTVPLTSTTTLYAWPVLRMPSAPALAGASFYEHAFFVDPPANRAGIVTTWSGKWTFGAHPGAAAALLYTFGAATNNPSGTLRGRTGVSILLRS